MTEEPQQLQQSFNQRFKEAFSPLRLQFRRAPTWVKVVAFICLVYILTPIDPWDVLVPWLAWQDDLFIAGVLLKLLHKYGARSGEVPTTAKDLLKKLFTKS